MTEIAFADYHPGEERSDRRGKAASVNECRAERKQQNGKQKEISRVRPGNPGKPGAEKTGWQTKAAMPSAIASIRAGAAATNGPVRR